VKGAAFGTKRFPMRVPFDPPSRAPLGPIPRLPLTIVVSFCIETNAFVPPRTWKFPACPRLMNDAWLDVAQRECMSIVTAASNARRMARPPGIELERGVNPVETPDQPITERWEHNLRTKLITSENLKSGP
jgi:hypothetical protein